MLISVSDLEERTVSHLAHLDEDAAAELVARAARRRQERLTATPLSRKQMAEFAERFDRTQTEHDWRWSVIPGDPDTAAHNRWAGPARHPEGMPAAHRARWATLSLDGQFPYLALSERDDGSALLLADGSLAVFDLDPGELTGLDDGLKMLRAMGFQTLGSRQIVVGCVWRVRVGADPRRSTR